MDELINRIVNQLIDIIRKNNAPTLIGTLEASDKISKIVYDKTVCSYNKEIEDDLQKFQDFPLDMTFRDKPISEINTLLSSNISIKQKYLELKAKSKL